jgi:hypothetical protein
MKHKGPLRFLEKKRENLLMVKKMQCLKKKEEAVKGTRTI